MIAVANTLCGVVQSLVPGFVGFYTKNQMNLSAYCLITISKILGSFTIRVLVDFKILVPDMEKEGFWQDFMQNFDYLEEGTYSLEEGFTPDWYKKVGVITCYSLIYESLFLYLYRVIGPLYHFLTRCRDRGGRL